MTIPSSPLKVPRCPSRPYVAVINAFEVESEPAREYTVKYTPGVGYGFTLAGTRPVFVNALEEGGSAKVLE